MRTILVATCVLSFLLNACAADHLNYKHPWPLLSEPATGPHQMNRLIIKEILANRLNLSWAQRRQFYGLMDRFQTQHQALRPRVLSYQKIVQRAFEQPQFNLNFLLSRWEQLEAPFRKQMAQETSEALWVFWKSLSVPQRQGLHYQIGRFKARWTALAEPAWRSVPTAQAQTFSQIKAQLKLTPQQSQVLQAQLAQSQGYLFWEAQIDDSSERWQALLQQSQLNPQELQDVAEKLYNNSPYILQRLKALQQLHASLSPAQRSQLLQLS